MYDDVTLSLIPEDAEAVAGYVNGLYENFQQVVLHWPHAHHLAISVTSTGDAECLDVEPGDATNATAPEWVKRQIARGVKRPVVYTSTSNAPALVKALAVAGIPRALYRLWTAHYTHREHLCDGRCGFGDIHADATQWTDKALGRSLDQSICSDGFFAPKPKPNMDRVFVNWAKWIQGGRKWRRPGNAPKRIPMSWWLRLPKWLATHRKKKKK